MNAEKQLDKLMKKVSNFEIIFYKVLEAKEDKKLKAKLNSLADDVANMFYKICEAIENE